MGENVIETGRFSESFAVSSDEHFVRLDAMQGFGFGTATMTFHYRLPPTLARQLAHTILAQAEASERLKMEKK